jgi:sarcosine oxidase
VKRDGGSTAGGGGTMGRIGRRKFLQTTGLAAAAAAAGARRAAGMDAAPGRQAAERAPAGASPDVVVVGAGAFGVWTALSLRERGIAVTLLDAYGPGSPRATSGDETRQIRVGYGDREHYSRWALQGFERWKAREQQWNRRLLCRTGRLQLAGQWTPALEATAAVFRQLGVEHERLSHDELRRRHPQLNPEGVEVALFEPGAAVIRAREAIMSAAAAFQEAGGTLQSARALPGRASGARLEDLALASGDRLAARAFVFACGPWLRRIFPDLMRPRLSTPRREVFYFGTPPGDDRFTWPNLPNYSEATYYGFPSIDARGFKVCPTTGEPEMDPDADDRVVSAHQVKRARDYLALRFPALKDQPIVETRVCQLENTPDEHFVIDRHPAWENVLIAGGGSGHGFKHGPVLGEYIADRIMERPGDAAVAALFRLDRPAIRP